MIGKKNVCQMRQWNQEESSRSLKRCRRVCWRCWNHAPLNCQLSIKYHYYNMGKWMPLIRFLYDVLTPTHNMIEPQKYIHRKLPHSRLLSWGTKQGAISSVIFYFCVEDAGEPIFRTANIIIFSCIEILSLLGWNICVKWWINSLRIFLVSAWLGHQGAV